MKSSMYRAALCACLAVAAFLPLASQAAESVEDFYKKNNQVRFLIPVGPGSSHEVWARLLGAHWSKRIPGKPTFVIQSMLGGGGLTLANYMQEQAPRDGTVIGVISSSIPTQIVMGVPNANLKPTEVGWIGSPEASDQACVVNKKSGITSVQDVMTREEPLGTTGPSNSASFIPKLINVVAGTKFKFIEGYKDSAEIWLALDRGEVSGTCAGAENFWRSPSLEKVQSGEFKLLFNTLSPKPNPKLPGVPSVFEFIKKAEDKALYTFVTAGSQLGRPYFVPPGVPQDRLDALRSTFAATMKDPEFLADAAKAKVDVDFVPGTELATITKGLFATPKDVVERAATVMPKM